MTLLSYPSWKGTILAIKNVENYNIMFTGRHPLRAITIIVIF